MTIQIPEIFAPLLTENYRYNLVHGGRGSGKTETLARFFLAKGLERSRRILCAREIQKTIKESVHQVLEKVIYEENFPYTVQKTSIFSNQNNSEFIFSGLRDQTVQGVKSITSSLKNTETISATSL